MNFQHIVLGHVVHQTNKYLTTKQDKPNKDKQDNLKSEMEMYQISRDTIY